LLGVVRGGGQKKGEYLTLGVVIDLRCVEGVSKKHLQSAWKENENRIFWVRIQNNKRRGEVKGAAYLRGAGRSQKSVMGCVKKEEGYPTVHGKAKQRAGGRK